jgi:SAM-dependent methyltransferase
MDSTAACPLCRSDAVRAFATVQGRGYLECDRCGLAHLAAAHWLGPEAERAHYLTHENDPADPGYRAFLARLADPLAERLPPGAEGLDYGAGPGPTLSLMLEERGFPTEIYDPLFAPDPAPLRRGYDFVTCTETAEHFFDPAGEFHRLDRLLRPGGWLAVMTEMVPEERPFEQWRYARDPTHVCFYRRRTMEWIAARFAWSAAYPHRDVVLFRKPAGSPPGDPAAPAR